MKRLLLAASLLLCPTVAHAVDAHGAPIVPSGGESVEPFTTWQPDLIGKGRYDLGVTFEGAERLWVTSYTDAEGTTETEVLGKAITGTLSGVWSPFARFGIAASMPVHVYSVAGGEEQPAVMGDTLFWLPVKVVDGKVSVLVLPEVGLPTGSALAHLGTGSYSLGLRGAVGQRGEHLDWAADVGLRYAPLSVEDRIDTRLLARADASVDYRPWRFAGVGVEAWVAPSLLAENVASSTAGEVLGRVGFRVFDGLSVTFGGGTAITPGVGGSVARLMLRVSYGGDRQPVAAVKPDVPVEPPPAPPPPEVAGTVDLHVHVRTSDGSSAPTTLVARLGEAEQTLTTDAAGDLTLRAAPGAWTVTARRDGYADGVATTTIAADRLRPVDLDVLIAPTGGNALEVRVVDVSGAPVERAVVQVDGGTRGATSPEGALRIPGVGSGERKVVVTAEGYRAGDPLPVVVSGDGHVDVTLQRPPGSVQVVVRSEGGPVSDAAVRFSGPEEVGPEPIGAAGEHRFTLLPGSWVAAVSATSFGLQEREFTVKPGEVSLVVIDVILQKSVGEAELLVRTWDPAGHPVDGADIRIDDHPVGSTNDGGNLRVTGLAEGERVVSVSAPHFQPVEPLTVKLLKGLKEVDVPMRWNPGSLRVVAKGIEGARVDATVRLEGPQEVPPTSLGPDGQAFFTLQPGEWTVALSSPAYGLQERVVTVRPDDESLLTIDAGLLGVTGDAGLRLTVLDPAGVPIPGARVRLDGRDAGDTSTGGDLAIAGLAAGRHDLAVEADHASAFAETVRLEGAETRKTVTLRWTDAFLRLRAIRPPSEPARDALARFYGAAVTPATPLGASGVHTFALAPGDWTVVVSSQQGGVAEKPLTVTPGGETQEVVVALPVGGGPPMLRVVVVDPEGRPVPGATVRAKGDLRTGADGAAQIAEPGDGLDVSVEAPGFVPLKGQRVAAGEGTSEVRLRLRWAARPVDVRVIADGAPIVADVAWAGPGRAAPARTGSDGHAIFALQPGAWQVLVSTTDGRVLRQEVTVPAGADVLAVEAKLAAAKVTLTATQVEIRDQVQFDFDQATINPASYAVLDQVVATLLLHPELVGIEVEGHTDARGTEVYNLDLSQRRAEAVLGYLVRKGVDPTRLRAVGYGATRAIATNETEAGRAQNRRVQFRLEAPKAP